MARDPLSMETRIELSKAPITLDGKRAQILGLGHDFATIRSVGATGGEGYAYSWNTVARIVAYKGGHFKS